MSYQINTKSNNEVDMKQILIKQHHETSSLNLKKNNNEIWNP